MRNFSVIAACILSYALSGTCAVAEIPTAVTSAIETPADLYGPLFEAVQLRKIFKDGKTFVDAVPRRPPDLIMADYHAKPAMSDAALRAFVVSNFDVPTENVAPVTIPGERLSLKAHIKALWPQLSRPPPVAVVGSSALSMPEPYIVPGGRFREIYYWDSYFTMLGLAEDGEDARIESMRDNFEYLVETHGRIPNGTRTYYLSRSQPPLFALMTTLSANKALMCWRAGWQPCGQNIASG